MAVEAGSLDGTDSSLYSQLTYASAPIVDSNPPSLFKNGIPNHIRREILDICVGWLLMLVIRSGLWRKLWGWLTKKFGGLSATLTSSRAFPLKIIGLVVVIYFVGSLAYLGVTAKGVSLNLITRIWQGQTATIATEIGDLTPSNTTTTTSSETGKPSGFFDFTRRESLIQTAFGLDFDSATPQGKGF